MFYAPAEGFAPGDIKAHGRAALPTGWLWCDGSAVSRATYAALFAAIGTAFGVGDGVTTFNVPDLRGRLPIGKDNMGVGAASRLTTAGGGVDGATLGAVGGAQNITLTTANLASHQHVERINAANVNQADSSGAAQGIANSASANNATAEQTALTGSGTAHFNVPPAQVLNMIVKT